MKSVSTSGSSPALRRLPAVVLCVGLLLGSLFGVAAAASGDHDADGDGLGDATERNIETDLRGADTDGDALSDGNEVNLGTDPRNADTDRDGVPDGPERRWSSNPTVPDTDGDGLTDGMEASLGTDPVNRTTSGLVVAGCFGFATGLFALVGWHRVRSSATRLSTRRTRSAARDADRVVNEPDPLSEAGDDALASADVILTSRERVRRLLAENGGRMKQRTIVETTGWSKSKVSQFLSEMEADGEIAKVRVGRQNVVCLPDREPGIDDRPFEDRN